MSVVFVANRVSTADYHVIFDGKPIAYVTIGTDTDLEQIAAVLLRSTPNDYLCLDGSPAICAICVVMWLHMHGQVMTYHLAEGKWKARLITSRAVQHHIERQRDLAGGGRG